MKRAYKRRKSGSPGELAGAIMDASARRRPQPVLPIARPPAAESGHNLFVQMQAQHATLEELRAMLHTANERLAKLEQAVVPPSLYARAKSAVGM